MATLTSVNTTSSTPLIPNESSLVKENSRLKTSILGITLGGIAACGASTFSNPMEVVKTRLQLQGELVRMGTLSAGSRPYRNSFQALKVIFQHEGLRGIQRGLGVGYANQVFLNGSRLGLFEPLRDAIIAQLDLTSRESKFAASIFAGGFSGALGAFLGSPLFLVKTRQQSYSPVFKDIGHQHEIKSALSALQNIYKTEGVKGLYRGGDAAAVRACVGSAVQMTSYSLGKEVLMERFDMKDTLGTHFASSMLAGFLVCTAMNPLDVILTRMYNQGVDPVTGQGLLYKTPMDCGLKIIKAEGLYGLYKGFSAHYLRVGPHTTLMFIFMEQLKSIYTRYFGKL